MKQLNYKHCCVIDTDSFYKTFVLVLLNEVPDEDGEGTTVEEDIQNYNLQEGEQLVDSNPPVMRPYAGASGFIKPMWSGTEWIESATSEEIESWESEHPAPEPVEEPDDPTDLASRVESLEANSATKDDVQSIWDEMAAAYAEGVNSI